VTTKPERRDTVSAKEVVLNPLKRMSEATMVAVQKPT
jgi:hypothetical protein